MDRCNRYMDFSLVKQNVHIKTVLFCISCTHRVFLTYLNINGKNVLHGFDFLHLRHHKRDFFNSISNNVPAKHEKSCLVKISFFVKFLSNFLMVLPFSVSVYVASFPEKLLGDFWRKILHI